MLTLFVVQTVLAAFAATSGLLFNGYILSVLIWQKRIQNANNLFLLNLAIVDILFCLTVLFGNTSLSIFIGTNLTTVTTTTIGTSTTVTTLTSPNNKTTESLLNEISDSMKEPFSLDQQPSSPSSPSSSSSWLNEDSSSPSPSLSSLPSNLNEPSHTGSLILDSHSLIDQRLGPSEPIPELELPHLTIQPILPTSQGELLSLVTSSSSSTLSPSSSSLSSSWILVPTPFSLLSLVTNFQGYLWTALPIIFVWTVTGLTIDKYIAISSPLHYSRLITTRRVTSTLFTSWLIGLTLAFPPLLPSITGCGYTFSFYRSSATITCDTSNYPWLTLVYIVIYILFSILLPLLAITICNFHILLIAESHRHRIISAIYEITLRGSATPTPGSESAASNHRTPIKTPSHQLFSSSEPSSPTLPTPTPPPTSALTTTTHSKLTSDSISLNLPNPIHPMTESHSSHRPVTGACSTSSASSSSSHRRSAESLSRRRSRDAFMPVTQLVGSLLLFTAPNYIIFCLETLDHLTIEPILLSAVTLCLILMPTINAYIYGVKSRLIRTTFKRLLHRYLYKQDVSLEIERRLSLRSQGSQNSLFRSHYARRNSCPILVQASIPTSTIPTPPPPPSIGPSSRIRSDSFWFTFASPNNNNMTAKLTNNNWSSSLLINCGQANQQQSTSTTLPYSNHHFQNYPHHHNQFSQSQLNPILRRQSLCIMEIDSNDSAKNTKTSTTATTNGTAKNSKSSLSFPIHRIFNQQLSSPFNRFFAIDSVVKLSPIQESTATSENV